MSVDALHDAGDAAGHDLGTDTGTDTGTDPGGDTGHDLGTDTDGDTGIDVPRDTGIDTGVDVPRDTGIDTGVDVPRDTGIDTGIDTGVDVPRDTGNDTGNDTGVDVPFPSRPIALAPLANRRLLGELVQFEASLPRGASNPILVLMNRECQGPRESPLPSGRGERELGAGLYCWRVRCTLVGGGVSESPTQRFWVAGNGGTRLVARSAGFFPDYNRAGEADLLVGYNHGGASGVVLQSTTASAAATALISPNGPRVFEMGWHVGDLDGDGFGDALLRLHDGSLNRLLYARGGVAGLGNFLSEFHTVSRTTDPGFARVVGPLGDLDGDGRPEVVSINFAPPTSYFLYRSTDAYRPTPGTIPFPYMPIRAAAVGPGLRPNDVGSLLIRNGQGMHILPITTAGASAWISIGSAGGDELNAQFALSAGMDLNGDGLPEFAAYQSVPPSLNVLQYDVSSGGFASVIRADLQTSLSVPATALLAPGPTALGMADSIVLQSPQGFLFHQGNSTSFFSPRAVERYGASLGPLGSDTQGAFATVATSPTRSLITVTQTGTSESITVVNYTGFNAANITWMAP